MIGSCRVIQNAVFPKTAH